MTADTREFVQWLNAETKKAALRRSKHAGGMERITRELEREQARLPLYAAVGAVLATGVGLFVWFIL